MQITAVNTRSLAFRNLPYWERVEMQCERLPWSGCWIFTGYTVGKGYGCAHDNGHHKLVHRASWERHRGTIPEGMFVLHRCDTPSCFNPEHLFLGTLLDNNRDRESKGRGNQPSGSTHPRAHAVLTEQQALEIRIALRSPTYGIGRRLASQYGVAESAITAIKQGKTWKHMQ